MIKFTRFVLLILLALSMLMSVSCGKDKTDTEFLYEISEKEAIITGYSGLDSHITIPSKIKGHPVTKIAENAFRGMVGLKSVTIPNSVKTIDYAFAECPDLTSVKIGNGVISMSGAFKNCAKLTSVTGGGNAAQLSEAFMNCTSLKSGMIPKTAESCVSAFRGCTALETVEIEDGVTALPYTFKGCKALKEVTLPSTVTEALHTFENCSSLVSVNGSQSLTELEGTFSGCSSLTELSLGSNVKILKGAFVNCKALTKIADLPSEVVEYSASFTGCSSLSEIVIPKTASPLPASYSFSSDVSGCSALEKLTANTDFLVTDEFCKTFASCSSLKELILPDSVAVAWIRVDSMYSDSIYTGKDSKVTKAVNNCKKASNIRITYNYGYIDEKSYTYIFGGDVNIFSPEDVAAETSILDFETFTRSYYWCGYPSETNRKNTTVAIEREYTFYLRVTGGSNGTLPLSVIINGMECAVENG